jgi:ribonuclease HI
MSNTDAFQMMMKSSHSSEKNTKSGYSIIRGLDTTDEESCYLLQFDGLSEPNPGTSTGGAVMFYPNSRKVLFERGEFIDYATNNQAEYTGLLIGIKSAIDLGIKQLLIEGDSKLVILQSEGKWKVKSDNLKNLNKETRDLLTHFDFVAIRHVYRDNNQYADRITNDVLKSKKSFYKKMSI